MQKLIIVIEKSADYYDAYAENCEGIYGAGETTELACQNALTAIDLLKSNSSRIPDILRDDYEIEWQYDISIVQRAGICAAIA
jgi:predicted RNase H-like HicB family nuclease